MNQQTGFYIKQSSAQQGLLYGTAKAHKANCHLKPNLVLQNINLQSILYVHTLREISERSQIYTVNRNSQVIEWVLQNVLYKMRKTKMMSETKAKLKKDSANTDESALNCKNFRRPHQHVKLQRYSNYSLWKSSLAGLQNVRSKLLSLPYIYSFNRPSVYYHSSFSLNILKSRGHQVTLAFQKYFLKTSCSNWRLIEAGRF